VTTFTDIIRSIATRPPLAECTATSFERSHANACATIASATTGAFVYGVCYLFAAHFVRARWLALIVSVLVAVVICKTVVMPIVISMATPPAL
jgi:hypothetical protein